MGLLGVMRGKVMRTTIGDAKTPCPLDRVNRQFRAEPNQLWVSDFTYVSTWQGWLYVSAAPSIAWLGCSRSKACDHRRATAAGLECEAVSPPWSHQTTCSVSSR